MKDLTWKLKEFTDEYKKRLAAVTRDGLMAMRCELARDLKGAGILVAPAHVERKPELAWEEHTTIVAVGFWLVDRKEIERVILKLSTGTLEGRKCLWLSYVPGSLIDAVLVDEPARRWGFPRRKKTSAVPVLVDVI